MRLTNIISLSTGKKDANYGSDKGVYPFFTCASEPIACNDYSFDGESILVPGNGANVGLVIYYNGKFEAYQRTYVIQKSKFNIKFIYYNMLAFWDEHNRNKQYGSATNYIKLGNFESYNIALPPLSEQQRIVERIEELFAKLDEAKERLQEVADSFAVRKAAILHKAFTGELTKQWRCENGVSDESWEEKTIGEICSSLKYGTSKKSSDDGEVVVLRMGNLQNGEIDWSNLAYTSDEEDIKKYLLKSGDVLFNRTNSPELVGKTSIYRGEMPAIYAGYLIKLDYEKNIVVGDYLNY